MSEIDWSKAPEGATHCDPVTGYWWGPSSLVSDGFSKWSDANGCWVEHANTHRPDIEIVERLIPRPTQWRGPEDGLPPVGTVCEVWRRKERVECEIVAHVQSDGVTEAVYQCATDWGWSSTSFRPLKSDKERAIDAAVAATILKDGPRIRAALSDIYDAGLLRLPEEQS